MIAEHSFPGLIAVALLVGLVLCFVLIKLKRAASAVQFDELKNARLKRVYSCFLLLAGGLVVVVGAATLSKSSQQQQGYLTVAGILLAVVAWITVPVAAYNSLLLWRLRPIRILWLLAALFASMLALLADRVPDHWIPVIVLAYSLSTIAIALRGLVVIRQPTVGRG